MSGQIRYSDEFKIDAVAQVTERGYSVNGGEFAIHKKGLTLLVELPGTSFDPLGLDFFWRSQDFNSRHPFERLGLLGQLRAFRRFSEDATELKGQYWQNRSWNLGLNAAGLIVLPRKPRKSMIARLVEVATRVIPKRTKD